MPDTFENLLVKLSHPGVDTLRMAISMPMNTLAEIEAAAERLPVPQKEALVAFLTAELRREQAARAPTDLREFSGVLQLTEDPLGWQRRLRGEWE